MNLPNTFADKDCLVFEQGSDGGLYIGTDVGVYFTDNKRIAAFDPLSPEDADDLSNTTGWVRLGGALPHVVSHGLEINYQVNRLRNGMNGRGVWEHGLRCPPDPEDRSETSVYTADAFVEARNDVGSDAVVPAGFKVSYRAGNSVHLTPGFHAQSASRFHALRSVCTRSTIGCPANTVRSPLFSKSSFSNGKMQIIRSSSFAIVFTRPFFQAHTCGLM